MASNFLFDGAKVELQKSISLAPMFQVNHSFALGGLSPGAAAPSPGNYNFAAVVVHENLRRLGDSVCWLAVSMNIDLLSRRMDRSSCKHR